VWAFSPRGRGRGEKGEGLRAYGIGLIRGINCLLIARFQLRGFRPKSLCVVCWWCSFAGAGLVARVSTFALSVPLYSRLHFSPLSSPLRGPLLLGPLLGATTLITQSVSGYKGASKRPLEIDHPSSIQITQHNTFVYRVL